MKLFSVITVLALGIGSAWAQQERTVRIPLLADARSPGQTQWKYTTTDPGTPDWSSAAYDAAAWGSGFGGFGTGVVTGSNMATEWAGTDIWLRKTFDLPDLNPEFLILSHHHDEEAEFFLNGVMVYQESGWIEAYAEVYLSDEFKSALKPEGNVFAVHCRNTDGAGYIDAGLAYTVTFKTASLIADARTFPEEWRYTTSDPGFDWQLPAFSDADWTAGRAGFGTPDLYSATSATEWLGSDLWMRKTFTLDNAFPHYLASFMHDDDMEVYINGTLVLQDASFTQGYRDLVLEPVAQALRQGVNSVAVHCHNNDGPGYIDFGLLGLEKPAPTAVGRARRQASGRGSERLYASQGRLVLGGLAAASGGRLELFGPDGHFRASLSAGKGQASLALPAALGTGMFRYRWDSPSGMRQGTLVRQP